MEDGYEGPPWWFWLIWSYFATVLLLYHCGGRIIFPGSKPRCGASSANDLVNLPAPSGNGDTPSRQPCGNSAPDLPSAPSSDGAPLTSGSVPPPSLDNDGRPTWPLRPDPSPDNPFGPNWIPPSSYKSPFAALRPEPSSNDASTGRPRRPVAVMRAVAAQKTREREAREAEAWERESREEQRAPHAAPRSDLGPREDRRVESGPQPAQPSPAPERPSLPKAAPVVQPTSPTVTEENRALEEKLKKLAQARIAATRAAQAAQQPSALSPLSSATVQQTASTAAPLAAAPQQEMQQQGYEPPQPHPRSQRDAFSAALSQAAHATRVRDYAQRGGKRSGEPKSPLGVRKRHSRPRHQRSRSLSEPEAAKEDEPVLEIIARLAALKLESGAPTSPLTSRGPVLLSDAICHPSMRYGGPGYTPATTSPGRSFFPSAATQLFSSFGYAAAGSDTDMDVDTLQDPSALAYAGDGLDVEMVLHLPAEAPAHLAQDIGMTDAPAAPLAPVIVPAATTPRPATVPVAASPRLASSFATSRPSSLSSVQSASVQTPATPRTHPAPAAIPHLRVQAPPTSVPAATPPRLAPTFTPTRPSPLATVQSAGAEAPAPAPSSSSTPTAPSTAQPGNGAASTATSSSSGANSGAAQPASASATSGQQDRLAAPTPKPLPALPSGTTASSVFDTPQPQSYVVAPSGLHLPKKPDAGVSNTSASSTGTQPGQQAAPAPAPAPSTASESGGFPSSAGASSAPAAAGEESPESSSRDGGQQDRPAAPSESSSPAGAPAPTTAGQSAASSSSSGTPSDTGTAGAPSPAITPSASGQPSSDPNLDNPLFNERHTNKPAVVRSMLEPIFSKFLEWKSAGKITKETWRSFCESPEWRQWCGSSQKTLENIASWAEQWDDTPGKQKPSRKEVNDFKLFASPAGMGTVWCYLAKDGNDWTIGAYKALEKVRNIFKDMR